MGKVFRPSLSVDILGLSTRKRATFSLKLSKKDIIQSPSQQLSVCSGLIEVCSEKTESRWTTTFPSTCRVRSLLHGILLVTISIFPKNLRYFYGYEGGAYLVYSKEDYESMDSFSGGHAIGFLSNTDHLISA